MDFSWSEEQVELRRDVVGFAEKKLNNDLLERDNQAEWPRELWKECADFGMLGLPFPEKYGGLDFDILSTMFAMEGLGYGCKDGGLIFGLNAQMWSVQMPIMNFGTEAQRTKYLTKLCSGDLVGAHGMTEPDSGSDAFSLRTTAEIQDDRYILNGTKTFVTNAPDADIFVVFATVNRKNGFMGITAFIVERGFPGFHVGKPISKMGLKTAPMAELVFNECEVPLENRLGREGNGAAIFNDSMEWERSCILASCTGAMERQINDCIEYARQRKQFGKPIGKYQSLANRIVDMKVRMETSRLMIYKVAWMKSNNQKAPLDAAIAKLYLSEAWVSSCLDAVQVFGGYGYTTEYEIERDLRDSVAGTLLSGTSEIQRNIISQQLGL